LSASFVSGCSCSCRSRSCRSCSSPGRWCLTRRCGAHAVFHLIYLPILAVGWWALWRFVREPSNLALRVIVALMLLCQTSGLFGHAGELVAVVQGGFFSAPYSIWSENPHMFFAMFALGGIMASELLLIVLTVTAAVQRLLRRSPRVTGGQAPTSA